LTGKNYQNLNNLCKLLNSFLQISALHLFADSESDISDLDLMDTELARDTLVFPFFLDRSVGMTCETPEVLGLGLDFDDGRSCWTLLNVVEDDEVPSRKIAHSKRFSVS
jgi:hypothetical protein